MKISEDHKQQIIEGIQKYPDNMSAASRHINMPFGSFVRRAKALGIYAPNQGQAEARVEKQRLLSWDASSLVEKRRRLLEEQDSKCLFCGIGEWNGKSIQLEYDHINGNNKDDRKENVRYLCPNCHSQTPTFRNRGYTKIPDEKLKLALTEHDTIKQALLSVGYSTTQANYHRAKQLLK